MGYKWSNITLSQFLEVDRLNKIEPETQEEILDIRLKQYNVLNGGIGDEDKVKLKDLEEMKDFLLSPVDSKVKTLFKLKGNWYRVRLDPEEFSAKEYISVMNLAKHGEKYFNQIVFNICVPVYKTIFGYKDMDLKANEIEKRVKDFNEVTMDIVNPIRVFFLNLSTELTDVMLTYSENQMKKMKEEAKEVEDSLLKSTVG